MKSNRLRALLAVAIVVGMASASTGADDIRFSDFGVRLAANEPSESTIGGAVKAAFLSDDEIAMLFPPGVSRQPALMDLGSALQGGMSGGMGQSCECGAVCGCGEACDVAFEGDMACECGAGYGCTSCAKEKATLYAELQFLWLRAHVMEDAVGKLSEQYEFSPRLIAGYELPSGIGGRARYWHYGHQTEYLGDTDGIRFDFDVIDLEATSRFAIRKSDLVVSGGFRWASAEIATDDTVSTDLIGLTVAADLRTELCRKCDRQWASICGARLSVLGGDWDGQSGGFVDTERDDNVMVHELFAGVEYLCQTRRGANLYARLIFELQNWHSDAIAQTAGTDSIGFVGPGMQFGASF